MSERYVQNAKIEYTRLGVEHTDHGFLSFIVYLDFGSSAQGFGQVMLDEPEPETAKGDQRRRPTELAGSLLLGIHRLFGCDWEDLPYRPCRAYFDYGRVYGLGSFLEDRWLWFDAVSDTFMVTSFKKMQESLG